MIAFCGNIIIKLIVVFNNEFKLEHVSILILKKYL